MNAYPEDLYPECPCYTCMKSWSTFQRMALCPTCGNKRCPAAFDHATATCSGSNEPGQPGSRHP